MGVLRGAADRERAPRLAPCPRTRLQGHLPALPDDAREVRRAQGRLGLPRPAGRDRRREGARPLDEGRDRGVRHRRVQPEVPRVGLHVPGGLAAADRAHRDVGRPGRRLPHARHHLHRVGLVGAEADLEQGPAVRGSQGRPVLPALRHVALEPRGRAGLPRRDRPERLRALPGDGCRRARCRTATS